MRTFISLDEEKPTFHKLTTVFFFFYLFIFLKGLKHACLDSICVISLPGLTQKRSFYPLVSLLALCVGQRSHQHQPGSCRTGAVVLDVHVCLTCAPLCLQQSHKSEQHVQTQVSRGPVGSDHHLHRWLTSCALITCFHSFQRPHHFASQRLEHA